MPTIQELIQDRLDRLESVPGEFYNRTSKTEKNLIDAFIKAIGKLDSKDDAFVLSNNNYAKVEQLAEELKKELFAGEYSQALKSFASEFPLQATLANAYFEKEFANVFKYKKVYDAAVKNAQRQALSLLDSGAIDSAFIAPLKQQLSTAISTGSSYAETVKALTQYIQGNKDIDGALLRHVKQVASDGFSVFDRSYGQSIANDIGAEWYVYRGGLVEDSRDFCTKHNGKYYHKNEIAAMASQQWQGKMKGTNSSTIFAFAGGYRCLHTWMPVSIFKVPKEVIARNKKLGNYEE